MVKKSQMALALYCWTLKVLHWKIFFIDTRIRNVCLLQHAFDPLVQSSSLYKLQNIFWQKGVWFVWFENKPLRFSVAMLPQSITIFTLVALLTLRPVWDDLDKIRKNSSFCILMAVGAQGEKAGMFCHFSHHKNFFAANEGSFLSSNAMRTWLWWDNIYHIYFYWGGEERGPYWEMGEETWARDFISNGL